MKQITNKEYEEFQKYKEDKLYGRVLTSDGLRLICAAENYDPETIGKRMLETLAKIGRKQRISEMKKKTKNKVLLAIGGIALTVAGFIIIPPMIDKYGNKIYKASLKKDDIDFDNIGPEIIKKESKEGEE